MVRSIVQQKIFINVDSITMDAAPNSGNLLVVQFTHWNNGPVAQSPWQQIYNVNGVTDDGMHADYKVCSGTETAFQKPVALIGNQAQGIIYEFNGVSSADILTNHNGVDQTAAPAFTNGAFNTGADNTMIFGVMAGYTVTGTTAIAGTVTQSQTNDGTQLDNVGANRHAAVSFFHRHFATNGGAVAMTDTFGFNQNKGSYGLISLQWDAAASPGGSGNVDTLRSFPAPNTLRLFPINSGRSFPVT